MRILNFKLVFSLLFFLFLSHLKLNAQEQGFNFIQNPKFEELLNTKRKQNAHIALQEAYKIQIFSGENDKAKAKLNEFKQEFKKIEATIIFRTPNYKVWVGVFKTRLEAEKHLIMIKKKYNTALLIKPNK
jgi:hypothetical protein